MSATIFEFVKMKEKNKMKTTAGIKSKQSV